MPGRWLYFARQWPDPINTPPRFAVESDSAVDSVLSCPVVVAAESAAGVTWLARAALAPLLPVGVLPHASTVNVAANSTALSSFAR